MVKKALTPFFYRVSRVPVKTFSFSLELKWPIRRNGWSEMPKSSCCNFWVPVDLAGQSEKFSLIGRKCNDCFERFEAEEVGYPYILIENVSRNLWAQLLEMSFRVGCNQCCLVN